MTIPPFYTLKKSKFKKNYTLLTQLSCEIMKFKYYY